MTQLKKEKRCPKKESSKQNHHLMKEGDGPKERSKVAQSKTLPRMDPSRMDQPTDQSTMEQPRADESQKEKPEMMQQLKSDDRSEVEEPKAS